MKSRGEETLPRRVTLHKSGADLELTHVELTMIYL